MNHRDRVSRCFLSVTLFLLALVTNVTPVAYLDGMFHQSDVMVSVLEREGMLLAGTPHGPIAIDGDADFTATALLEGWPGDGSPEDPYIIDGLDIDLTITTPALHCISISNTRVSFIIRNCNLTGAGGDTPWGGEAGIYLGNVSNCELVNNTCTSNETGINLYESDSNTVSDNTCNDNNRGIWLFESDSNTVANNTCNNNDIGIYLHESDFNNVSDNTCNDNNRGIFLEYSDSNTVTDNICTNNRIGISLDDESYYNIVANNTCNNHDSFNITSNEDFINQGWPGSGRANDPFLISGLSIESDSLCVGIFNTTSHFVIGGCVFRGHAWTDWLYSGTGVLLANVTNGVLENNRFFESEYGILLENVTHCRISKNLMEICLIGIELDSVYNSALLDNTIQEVEIGLMSRRCSDCTVANSIFHGGGQTGIWMDDAGSCILENNTIEGCGSGIWIQGSNSRITENAISSCENGIVLEGTSSRVTENTISSCRAGISLGGSWNCILDFNIVHNNYNGIKLSDSNNCVIVDNLIYNNTYCGIYLDGSRNCTLNFNRVHHSEFGIRLWNSNDSLIVDNLIYSNTEIGIFLDWNCANNRIYGNKIGLNGQNAICEGSNNSWDDGVSRGNSWSDYNFTSQYIVQGEGQCIDHYPSLWILPRTYKGPVIFLLGGVLFLLPLGIVLGSRRHTASGIIQRTRYRLVFWCRKKKDDQDDIVVPTSYRLVSRLRKRSSIKHADVDGS